MVQYCRGVRGGVSKQREEGGSRPLVSYTMGIIRPSSPLRFTPGIRSTYWCPRPTMLVYHFFVVQNTQITK